MRSIMMTIAGAGILLLAACTKEDKTPEEPKKDLIPLKVGNKWTYRRDVVETFEGDPESLDGQYALVTYEVKKRITRADFPDYEPNLAMIDQYEWYAIVDTQGVIVRVVCNAGPNLALTMDYGNTNKIDTFIYNTEQEQLVFSKQETTLQRWERTAYGRTAPISGYASKLNANLVFSKKDNREINPAVRRYYAEGIGETRVIVTVESPNPATGRTKGLYMRDRLERVELK